MTNSRFEDLEKRCQKLKRIKITKIMLLFVLLSSLLGAYFYVSKIENKEPMLVDSTITTLSIVAEKNVSIDTLNIEENVTEQKSPEENATHENDKQNYDTLLLSPKLKEGMKQVPVEEKILLAPPSKVEIEAKDFMLNDALKAPNEAKKTLTMSVKSLGAEESLLKNFHSNSTFKTALDLAEFYFDTKDYKKAIVWAKEASKLGPTSDKPWIIYAKSKFYLGEKEESIRSLELYLGYSSSKEAKDLLNFYKGQL